MWRSNTCWRPRPRLISWRSHADGARVPCAARTPLLDYQARPSRSRIFSAPLGGLSSLPRLSGQQLRVMRAIEQCRTPALGGHLLQCDHCGAYEVRYHSCRNRHCPKCQALAKARWVEARPGRPPAHSVFPLCLYPPPHAQSFSPGQSPVLYPLLFQAAWDTLHTFGRDPRWLGGDLGATTWSSIPGGKTWTSISTCIVS